MHSFLGGVVATLCVVAAAFFVRFHRTSRDTLFLLFAAAFVVMAVNWGVLAFLPAEHESRPYFYLVRLVSYLLLIAGIVHANRRAR
ncbi:DUF5985 family protein [Myxococcota bacterium]|nr:DUF5985 family protein [Myxococcota bacterium]